MPDIKQVLYDEIRRLARKELKGAIFPLVKQLGEQKKVISALKKEIAALGKRIPEISEKEFVPVKVDSEDGKKLRLSASGIIKIRKKYGISQAELAALVGVSAHTVSLWEIGKVSPRANAKSAICSLRAIGKRKLKNLLEAQQKLSNAENNE